MTTSPVLGSAISGFYASTSVQGATVDAQTQQLLQEMRIIVSTAEASETLSTSEITTLKNSLAAIEAQVGSLATSQAELDLVYNSANLTKVAAQEKVLAGLVTSMTSTISSLIAAAKAAKNNAKADALSTSLNISKLNMFERIALALGKMSDAQLQKFVALADKFGATKDQTQLSQLGAQLQAAKAQLDLVTNVVNTALSGLNTLAQLTRSRECQIFCV